MPRQTQQAACEKNNRLRSLCRGVVCWLVPVAAFGLAIIFVLGRDEEVNESTEAVGNDNISEYMDKDGARILLRKTEHGNFEKQKFIDELTYILSYGRDSIEYAIDTVQYGERKQYYIDWESDKFLSLVKGCGTYCWSNTILTLHKKDSIMYASYSAFDAKNHRIVEIDDDNGNFIIYNLLTKETISISSRYHEFREYGYPLFFINIIQFNDSLLRYNITKEDGSIISFLVRGFEAPSNEALD